MHSQLLLSASIHVWQTAGVAELTARRGVRQMVNMVELTARCDKSRDVKGHAADDRRCGAHGTARQSSRLRGACGIWQGASQLMAQRSKAHGMEGRVADEMLVWEPKME
jgi:hypothetical protein